MTYQEFVTKLNDNKYDYKGARVAISRAKGITSAERDTGRDLIAKKFNRPQK